MLKFFTAACLVKSPPTPKIGAYVPFLGGEVRGSELEQRPERSEGVCPDFLRLSFFGKHSPRVVLDPARRGMD